MPKMPKIEIDDDDHWGDEDDAMFCECEHCRQIFNDGVTALQELAESTGLTTMALALTGAGVVSDDD